MVSMREEEICLGKNGHTRFGLLSSTLRSYNSYKLLQMSDLDVLIQIGLKGESLQLHSLSGSSSVEWESAVAWNQPLTWYKVRGQQSFRTFSLFFSF